MTRMDRTVWAILATVGLSIGATPMQAATPCQRCGVGHGAGYHACRTCGKGRVPPPIGHGVQGCSEYSLNMQMHVWDGYEYEPHLWRRHARQFKYLEPPVMHAEAVYGHGPTPAPKYVHPAVGKPVVDEPPPAIEPEVDVPVADELTSRKHSAPVVPAATRIKLQR